MKESIETLKGVVDAIFADMVGEATFLAAIAEINVAIAGLAEDITATITVLGAAIGGAIAAQTAALVADAASNTTSIIAAINNVSAQLPNILSALNTANSTLTTLSASVSAISTKIDTTNSALVSILGALNDVLTVLADMNQRILNIYNLLDLRLFQIQSNLDLIRDSNNDIAFATATTAARVQNLYELTAAQGSAQLTALETIITKLEQLHLDNSASSTLLSQINDSTSRIRYLIDSPNAPFEPILYTLVYDLWSVFTYGGYYDYGSGTLRVKNV